MLFNTTVTSFEALNPNVQDYFNAQKYNYNLFYDAAYLINLDRSPERLKRASEELEMANFKYNRFSAVDGYKLELKSLLDNKITTGQQLKDTNSKTNPDIQYKISYNHKEMNEITFDFKGSLTAGELGVLTSHIIIWRDALSKGYNSIIIFEDDIVIDKHEDFHQQVNNFIGNLPDNFDVGFIDYHQVAGNRYEILDNSYVNGISDDFVAWGSHAVVYSKSGIEKILSRNVYSKENDILVFKESDYFSDEGLKTYVSSIKFIDISGDTSTITDMGRGHASSYYENVDL